MESDAAGGTGILPVFAEDRIGETPVAHKGAVFRLRQPRNNLGKGRL
jgi:hypothetical protein